MTTTARFATGTLLHVLRPTRRPLPSPLAVVLRHDTDGVWIWFFYSTPLGEVTEISPATMHKIDPDTATPLQRTTLGDLPQDMREEMQARAESKVELTYALAEVLAQLPADQHPDED